jgi:uncharacterized integral membrane protein
MTHQQIIGEVVIALVVGLFLLVMGAVLQPLFKKMWGWINRPSPLTPQTKGQLVTSLEVAKDSLERLNYFSTHSKDLFLYLIQLVMAALLLLTTASAVYVVRLFSQSLPTGYIDLPLLAVVVLLALTGVLCALGLVEAGRMSDKKIDATKNSIQKNINEINRRLNPPV